jgi:hypothetical protein
MDKLVIYIIEEFTTFDKIFPLIYYLLRKIIAKMSEIL